MTEPLEPVLAELQRTLLDPTALVRAVAAGKRHSGPASTWRKAELRWLDLKVGTRLSVTTFDARQAFTRTIELGDESAVVAQLVAEPFGNWHVETSDAVTTLRITKRGQAQVHRSARVPAGGGGPGDKPPDDKAAKSHDRAKVRLLAVGHPVFHALGLADANGHVKPSRAAKLHQVEQFLRALEPVLPAAVAAAGAEPLRVGDLGCGNAYLTLAAYAWLTEVKGLRVELTGVDVKEQARARNSALVVELGWADHVTFVAASIEETQLAEAPHLVFALHACDTATDDALAAALRWRCAVVVAAPCCQHDLQRQIATRVKTGGSLAPGWTTVSRHGILRERVADVLTDALRAAILRSFGYRVEVIEFVDSAHTPRNVLLRAVFTGSTATDAQIAEYDELIAAWGVQPRLAELAPKT